MTTLIDAIEIEQNETLTENGAVTNKSTLSATLDYFGLGAALRTRTESDVVKLFSKAFAENSAVALKTLFYQRDCRGGQGERKTFRIILKHLAEKHPQTVVDNLENIVFFGRWDDLFCLFGTQVEADVVGFIKQTLIDDLNLLQKGTSFTTTKDKYIDGIIQRLKSKQRN